MSELRRWRMVWFQKVVQRVEFTVDARCEDEANEKGADLDTRCLLDWEEDPSQGAEFDHHESITQDLGSVEELEAIAELRAHPKLPGLEGQAA